MPRSRRFHPTRVTGMRFWPALLLTLGLSALLVANSADFFFRRPYHEFWDLAANSLLVDQAKRFAQLHGIYSRWGFHHPGPAMLYVQALGEWLFHDRWRVAAAPYNAQLMAHLFVTTGFFVAAVQIFTRWLPERRWTRGFLPAALGLGALHFALVPGIPSLDLLRGPSSLSGLWAAHAMVIPFLCLLAAGASVAAGRGGDLPVLVLAGGYLVHIHVSQPLFVVPVAGLAYVGLLVTRHQAAKQPAWSEVGPAVIPCWRRAARTLTAGWRAAPWAHGLALALLALFLVPIVVDLGRGADSNFAAILEHRRSHRGEHKAFARSLFYFVQFGAYAPYQPGQIEFGRYDLPGVKTYLRAHAVAYAGWLGVLATVLVGVLGHLRVLVGPKPLDDVRLNPDAAHFPRPADSWRFLTWGTALLGLTVGLTLFWGTIQDGPMYYYNAWFSFGIYAFALLLAVAVVCVAWPTRETSLAGRHPRPWWPAWVPTTATTVGIFFLADRLRVSDANPEATRAMHADIRRAIEAFTVPGDPRPIKALHFPPDAWSSAASVALQLERAGYGFAIEENWNWSIAFGPTHDWGAVIRRATHPKIQTWRLGLGAPRSEGAMAISFPLNGPVSVDVRSPALNLAGAGATAEIDLSTSGNLAAHVVGGWSYPEVWGAWGVGPVACLAFRAGPPEPGGDVEVTVDGHPALDPEHGVTGQRVRAYFDGEPLGSQQRLDAASPGPLVFTIPAELWRRAATGVAANRDGTTFEMELPDAMSPASFDPQREGDRRHLALGVHALRFRVVPQAPPPVAADVSTTSPAIPPVGSQTVR